MTPFSPTALPPPLRFTPDMEIFEEDEADIVSDIVANLRRVMDAAIARTGRAERSDFAGGYGVVRGEMAVIENLHPALRQGLFAEPRLYPVLLRFSVQPGRPPARGLAMKVVGVEGERLAGTEGERTQNFLMADAPAFSAPDARAFLRDLERRAADTDEVAARRKGAAAGLRGVETPGDPGEPHVLALTFHTQAPLLYGSYVAKLRLAPVGPELASLRQETIEVRHRPEALREALSDFFESQTGTFELAAQLMTDRIRMPIEDASVVWSEAESPYRPIARVTIPPQPILDGSQVESIGEGLSFSPWHGLSAHRPLGSIMRARRPAYEMSASFRASRNGCPIHDPRTEADLPI